MFSSLYDAKPFTIYRYYRNVHHDLCEKCGRETDHHLMQYKIYLGMRFPIIPTGNIHYLVCSSCGEFNEVTGTALMKLKERSRPVTPVKYNKYSQLDLEGYIEDEPMVFGTEEELRCNITLHLKDMNERSHV